jgi:hypothetical protein
MRKPREQTKEGLVSSLIKQDLKAKLPEYRFVVKAFSHNDQVDVYWLRGPEIEIVEEAIGKYRGDGKKQVNKLWLNRELSAA